MTNSLDPDQDRHSVRPDLGPSCFQRLSGSPTNKPTVTNMMAAISERNKTIIYTIIYETQLSTVSKVNIVKFIFTMLPLYKAMFGTVLDMNSTIKV